MWLNYYFCVRLTLDMFKEKQIYRTLMIWATGFVIFRVRFRFYVISIVNLTFLVFSIDCKLIFENYLT